MAKKESILRQVFLEVAREGEASLGARARALGLGASALARQLRALERRGLVEFRGRDKVALRAEFGYVVGVDLGASHVHLALADFAGEILNDANIAIRPEDGPHKMIGQIKEGIRALVARAGRGRVLALAVGVPSAVTDDGVVTFANNLPGWTNVPLKRELEKEFRLPIFMENDVNMAAIGEHWRGVARGVNNFVFIAVGTGIGSGVFIDGKLHRGRTGSAGEIYRMNIEWPRWDEDFPDTGYFENYVSGRGIAAEGKKIRARSGVGEPGGLREERDAYFVFEAFRRGHPDAAPVLERIFTMFGVGVANVVAVLDPDLIVLGGGVVKGAPEFMLATLDKVVRRIQPDPPPIKLSALEDKAQTYGATFAALTMAQQAAARRLK